MPALRALGCLLQGTRPLCNLLSSVGRKLEVYWYSEISRELLMKCCGVFLLQNFCGRDRQENIDHLHFCFRCSSCVFHLLTARLAKSPVRDILLFSSNHLFKHMEEYQ
ncbi:MAG: hypothetical protein NXY57DRAFT_506719 [Lentinula lateritia]|nr:MAG: hypothetical protein NXY57DRAFT_506719 [Lentinula lateritia]